MVRHLLDGLELINRVLHIADACGSLLQDNLLLIDDVAFHHVCYGLEMLDGLYLPVAIVGFKFEETLLVACNGR